MSIVVPLTCFTKRSPNLTQFPFITNVIASIKALTLTLVNHFLWFDNLNHPSKISQHLSVGTLVYISIVSYINNELLGFSVSFVSVFTLQCH